VVVGEARSEWVSLESEVSTICGGCARGCGIAAVVFVALTPAWFGVAARFAAFSLLASVCVFCADAFCASPSRG
jgi:hypothetical protein